MEFEWDPKKALRNFRKHGVSFQEATEAFSDPNAIDEFDKEHSSDKEHRFVLIGSSSRRLLWVGYTVRDEARVRIISARKAGKAAEKLYKNAKD